MYINADTKIATLLKENPEALETIISIDEKFSKLRNPILRKLMAGRTTIAAACRISGADMNAFFDKLISIGFEVEYTKPVIKETSSELPAFLLAIPHKMVHELDVRPLINAGKDPLKPIIQLAGKVEIAGVLKIINSFEPTPLIEVLKKQGFDFYSCQTDPERVESWFYKSSERLSKPLSQKGLEDDWDFYLDKFSTHLHELNVQQLAMPGPMMAILEALEKLPEKYALLVIHKRVPVFLLPELKERDFDFRIKEFQEGEVHLLIFKNQK